eukprot:SAG31_NODE_212_length_20157_cov_9.648868_14_plen_64_part_00
METRHFSWTVDLGKRKTGLSISAHVSGPETITHNTRISEKSAAACVRRLDGPISWPANWMIAR